MNMTGIELRHWRHEHQLSQAKLAELSGIPQHLLSAYELGKTTLDSLLLNAVEAAISDLSKVEEVRARNKRYQTHTYAEVERLAERVNKADRNSGNLEYCRVLDEISRMHSRQKSGDLSAISLFSGSGGFSLGFSAAGFLIKGFLELDPNLKKTYKNNFPTSLEMGGDITKIDQECLIDLSKKFGKVDVIFGGPPCQGFSLSGKRQVDDPRNMLFQHYLRFVDAFRPKMALLENVKLLTSMRTSTGTLVRSEICTMFEKHGYTTRLFEINAKDYGVPQHRERAIFVAVRNDLGLAPTLAERTHGRADDLFADVSRYRTFADACSDLPYIESGEVSEDAFHKAVKHPIHVINWLWDVPEGRSAHDNTTILNRPHSGYNTTYKRQVWNKPASTVQTTFGMISGCRNVHPIATRSLTIREAARIQSFPDSYDFVGSLGTIRKGIGNAVPPLLAFNLALHAKSVLLNLVEIPSL